MNLTPRQKEVLFWLQQGMGNKEIAKRLGISDSTIKLHMTKFLKIYAVRNRTQLAIFSEPVKLN